MTPDHERLNERMEQLSLNEVMPGFDKEKEWMQLSEQLHPAKKRLLIPMWSYAAAILVLIVVGGIITLFMGKTTDQQKIVQKSNIIPSTDQKIPDADNKVSTRDTASKASPVAITTTKSDSISPVDKYENIAAIKKHNIKENKTAKSYQTKNIVRNGTPCPIQICISQTMRCPEDHPKAISTCTTLEPEQSVKLTYKEHDKIAKNCSLTINEIELKSIATGETILLTASSFPSTAQDVFSYITGEKKGDILAGIFSSDCDHQNSKHNIKLDNSYGNIIIRE